MSILIPESVVNDSSFSRFLIEFPSPDYPECRGNVTTEGTIQTPNAPKTLFGDGGCIFWIQVRRNSIRSTAPHFLFRPPLAHGCKPLLPQLDPLLPFQAPRGKRPQVEFSFFSYGDRRRPNDNPKLDPKCQAERVEIRTESLHEGHV